MSFADFDLLAPKVQTLYETGLPQGDRTGWPSLDPYYTVAMNQWTLVTGIPHSGKSEFLDAMMVNLVEKSDWRFMIFSPENHPLELHISKILEKRVRKPFGRGPTERMTQADLDAGLAWIRGKFNFLLIEEPSLDVILSEVSKWTSGTRKIGVVVDPWNTLEHRHPRDMTLTQYVSEQLSWIINFTRNNNVHFWLVAHPKKPDKENAGKAPTPYDVSDSAHFYNKADCIITVHRNQDPLKPSQKVQIHVQKCRFKHIGRVGVIELMYDKTTGRYVEPLSVVSYAERKE